MSDERPGRRAVRARFAKLPIDLTRHLLEGDDPSRPFFDLVVGLSEDWAKLYEAGADQVVLLRLEAALAAMAPPADEPEIDPNEN